MLAAFLLRVERMSSPTDVVDERGGRPSSYTGNYRSPGARPRRRAYCRADRPTTRSNPPPSTNRVPQTANPSSVAGRLAGQGAAWRQEGFGAGFAKTSGSAATIRIGGASLRRSYPEPKPIANRWLERTAHALIQCAACRSVGARLMSSECDSMCALTIASAAAMASASPCR